MTPIQNYVLDSTSGNVCAAAARAIRGLGDTPSAADISRLAEVAEESGKYWTAEDLKSMVSDGGATINARILSLHPSVAMNVCHILSHTSWGEGFVCGHLARVSEPLGRNLVLSVSRILGLERYMNGRQLRDILDMDPDERHANAQRIHDFLAADPVDEIGARADDIYLKETLLMWLPTLDCADQARLLSDHMDILVAQLGTEVVRFMIDHTVDALCVTAPQEGPLVASEMLGRSDVRAVLGRTRAALADVEILRYVCERTPGRLAEGFQALLGTRRDGKISVPEDFPMRMTGSEDSRVRQAFVLYADNLCPLDDATIDEMKESVRRAERDMATRARSTSSALTQS